MRPTAPRTQSVGIDFAPPGHILLALVCAHSAAVATTPMPFIHFASPRPQRHACCNASTMTLQSLLRPRTYTVPLHASNGLEIHASMMVVCAPKMVPQKVALCTELPHGMHEPRTLLKTDFD
eukprot:TRINITY_DN64070_c0_g1_i1.p1 TRINITY_DN64070_c0_g1~~TRINITY_DN64070_c0_g1_i1.p1  ORF type:complete len:122 (-),score=8.07 TRINITY_DN64070_c0_g1_i1:15-380(-)